MACSIVSQVMIAFPMTRPCCKPKSISPRAPLAANNIIMRCFTADHTAQGNKPVKWRCCIFNRTHFNDIRSVMAVARPCTTWCKAELEAALGIAALQQALRHAVRGCTDRPLRADIQPPARSTGSAYRRALANSICWPTVSPSKALPTGARTDTVPAGPASCG